MVNPVGAFDAPLMVAYRAGWPVGSGPASSELEAIVQDVPLPVVGPVQAERPGYESQDRGGDRRGDLARGGPKVVAGPVRDFLDDGAQDDTGSGPGVRQGRADGDSVDTSASETFLREEALAKLRAYQAERALRYPDGSIEADNRKAMEAFRNDILFFTSLSPVERAIPEIAQALQSAEVMLPLRELADASTDGTDPRAPFIRLANRFLDILKGDGTPELLGMTADIRNAVAQEVWQVLGIARQNEAFIGTFSQEAESLIDRRLREAEERREAARLARKEGRLSVLA